MTVKTANEIKSSIDSIRYYVDRINKLTKQQFEADASLNDINTQIGSVRFDSLGSIGAGCQWIEVYCDNIIANLKRAVEQDKLLQIEETDE